MSLVEESPAKTIDVRWLVKRLSTIVGIPVTPFTSTGELDLPAYAQQLDFLITSGIDVLTPCGNTGEYFALSDAECRQIVTTTCRKSAGRATVLVGVGGDLTTAIDQARHAQKCGAEAVMVHHPPHPFVSGLGYFRYVDAIAQAVRLGVVPYYRSAAISDNDLIAVTRLPNVVAVKYAVNDLQRFGAVAAHPNAGEVAWICGTAEAWAPLFWALGATGFTSGLVNIAPAISRQILNALRAGDRDTVRRLWLMIKPFEDLRARNASEANVSVVKDAMEQLGLCTRHVRPPLSELNMVDRETVAQSLTQMEVT